MPIIECTIKRPREVTLGDTAYKFQPDDQGRFVADVKDEEHADILLDIRCYRLAATTKKQEQEQKQEARQAAQGSNPVATTPASAAVETTNATESGNPLVGQGLGGTIQPTGDDDGEGKDENGEGGEATTPLDRLKLAADYEAKFGKKPHHSQSAERIKQLLEQEDD